MHRKLLHSIPIYATCDSWLSVRRDIHHYWRLRSDTCINLEETHHYCHVRRHLHSFSSLRHPHAPQFFPAQYSYTHRRIVVPLWSSQPCALELERDTHLCRPPQSSASPLLDYQLSR